MSAPPVKTPAVIAEDLGVPLSRVTAKLAEIEAELLRGWAPGQRTQVGGHDPKLSGPPLYAYSDEVVSDVRRRLGRGS